MSNFKTATFEFDADKLDELLSSLATESLQSLYGGPPISPSVVGEAGVVISYLLNEIDPQAANADEAEVDAEIERTMVEKGYIR